MTSSGSEDVVKVENAPRRLSIIDLPSDDTIADKEKEQEDEIDAFLAASSSLAPSVLLPDDVVDFDPPPSAIKGGEGTTLTTQIRHIFDHQSLDDFEIEKVKAFWSYFDELKAKSEKSAESSSSLDAEEKRLVAHYSRLHSSLFSDDRYLLRWLQGNQWDIPKAAHDVIFHLHWRAETYPLRYKDVEMITASRQIAYIHGRDRCGRIIIYIKGKELSEVDTSSSLLVVFFILEIAIRRLMIKGKIEQWRVVVDLADVAYSALPIQALKQIASKLQRCYRQRLHGLFFLNTPWLLWGVWQMISPFLNESTRKKIKILSNEGKEELRAVVAPSQLEKKYGGDCKDVVDMKILHLPPPPFDE